MSYFNTLIQRGGAYADTPKQAEARELYRQYLPLLEKYKKIYKDNMRKVRDDIEVGFSSEYEIGDSALLAQDIKQLRKNIELAFDAINLYNDYIEEVASIPNIKTIEAEMDYLDEREIYKARKLLQDYQAQYEKLVKEEKETNTRPSVVRDTEDDSKSGSDAGRGKGFGMFPYIHNAMGPSPKLIF